MYSLDKNNEAGEPVGETEVIQSYANLDWQKKIQINMRFEKHQRFRAVM